jgi:hypothetical protein
MPREALIYVLIYHYPLNTLNLQIRLNWYLFVFPLKVTLFSPEMTDQFLSGQSTYFGCSSMTSLKKHRSTLSARTLGRFLNRVQVENLRVANLMGINLFTSSLELAKFSTWTRFKNHPPELCWSEPCLANRHLASKLPFQWIYTKIQQYPCAHSE